MKIRSIGIAGAAVLVTASLAACGSSSGGHDGKTYNVLVMGGLSAKIGILADNSGTSVAAAKASVDYANAHGGVDGKHVTLTVIDDQSDPTVAVTKLRAALAQNKPDLVLNSGPSTVAAATLPILNAQHILSMNIGPTATSSNPADFPLNFDISAGAAAQLAGYKPYLQSKGYKSVAILHGNSAYGQTYGTSAESVLKADGFTVTSNQEYDVTALDMTPQLQALQASKPDALIIDAYGAPLGYILKGVAKLGWNVPLIGNTSVTATNLTGDVPPNGLVGTADVKNLVMQAPVAAKYDASATAVNDAVQGMLKYGPLKASFVLAANYDALPLVMAAADAAKSTDATAIAKELINPTVLANAHTVMFANYGFTATSHSVQNVASGYTFIAPSVMKNSQFQ